MMGKSAEYYLSKGYDPKAAEYFSAGRRRITKVVPNEDFTLTLTFDNGAPRSGAYTQGIPLSGCPRKSIGPILFCRDYSTRGSLGEKMDGLLTLPQRFIAV